ncbi:hypothetical protein T265_08618 [Opisthorchis viverrini]|uniref:Uncharacterized protein n=1 Tax=Opisthorchis viverrini TaxID=6198 RepID=A0A075A7P2_OPIVI|nr:hypothetical protein T265_08618 [Opisthorchis viverrini]KER23494.1 hypothetical protein T265_08618 [Opisthorchis viverrini]
MSSTPFWTAFWPATDYKEQRSDWLESVPIRMEHFRSGLNIKAIQFQSSDWKSEDKGSAPASGGVAVIPIALEQAVLMSGTEGCSIELEGILKEAGPVDRSAYALAVTRLYEEILHSFRINISTSFNPPGNPEGSKLREGNYNIHACVPQVSMSVTGSRKSELSSKFLKSHLHTIVHKTHNRPADAPTARTPNGTFQASPCILCSDTES